MFFFLMVLTEAMGFWKKAQRLSAILITSYQGYILSTWSTTVDDDLDHLVEVVLVRSSCGKNISPLPPFPYCAHVEEVTVPNSHLRSGSMLLVLEGIVSAQITWNSSAWEIYLFPSFICLFIYL